MASARSSPLLLRGVSDRQVWSGFKLNVQAQQ
jgi:hypothetical protein